MPAKSEAQRRLFAIAEHHPEQLQSKNKKILGSMSKDQMHDFASTSEKDLPAHVDTDKAKEKTEKLKALRSIK